MKRKGKPAHKKNIEYGPIDNKNTKLVMVPEYWRQTI